MKPVVLMQGFYQRERNGDFPPGPRGVPCPEDPLDKNEFVKGDQPNWWWNHLAAQANKLARAGFTAIWLPPPLKGAYGRDSVGYDVFDDYDLGSKCQAGSTARSTQTAKETRYGSREQLERCVAVMRANGLDVYVDIVDDQRVGGNDPNRSTFTYYSAYDDDPNGGRFPKSPSCFHGYGKPDEPTRFKPPFVPQDPNVYDGDKEVFFGCDLAPIHGYFETRNEQPGEYVYRGLLDAADWLVQALDAQGFRLDNGKGISTDYLYYLRNHSTMANKFAVVEFYDGNLGALRDWLYKPDGMVGCCSAFDFPLHLDYLVKMCNTPAAFYMGSLDHAGLAGVDPFHAVTFAENHDTESNPEQRIQRNKLLAYAYILTSEGYPCVYYKDYSTDVGCLALKPHIDNLVQIHQTIAEGQTIQRYKSQDVFVFERLGGAHLLVGLNNSAEQSRRIRVDTGFPPNTTLHDYAEHAPDVVTDDNGSTAIRIPPNTDPGLGYVCYSRAGLRGDISISKKSVTQVYEGARDLDIKPADNVEEVEVCRVYAAADTRIVGTLTYVDMKDWTDKTSVRLTLRDQYGKEYWRKGTLASLPGMALAAPVTATGWYTFAIQSFDTPASNEKPAYKLAVTYTAPRKI